LRISIIVPVHNAAETLRRCVESLAVQKYSDLEVILIENNSEDASWEQCLALEKQYGFVKAVRTTEKGVSKARNIGLREASGDVIGFVDADDEVEKNLLQEISRPFLEKKDCDMVVFGVKKRGKDREEKRVLPRTRRVSFSALKRYVLCDSRISGYVWNKYWRKSCLVGLSFPENLSHSEDTYFVIQSLLKDPKRKAILLNKSLYVYYQQETGATGRLEKMFDEKDRLKLITAVDSMRTDFDLKGYTDILSRRLIFSMASSQYLRFVLEGKKREYVIRSMKKNMFCYLMTFYVAPLQTGKRIIRLLLSIVSKK